MGDFMPAWEAWQCRIVTQLRVTSQVFLIRRGQMADSWAPCQDRLSLLPRNLWAAEAHSTARRTRWRCHPSDYRMQGRFHPIRRVCWRDRNSQMSKQVIISNKESLTKVVHHQTQFRIKIRVIRKDTRKKRWWRTVTIERLWEGGMQGRLA